MVTTIILFLLLLVGQCTFSKTLFNKAEIIPLLDNNRAVLTANIDVSNFNTKMERFISEEIPVKIKGNLAQYTESERFKNLVRNESKDEIVNLTRGIVNDLFNSFIHSDKFRRNLTTFAERFLRGDCSSKCLNGGRCLVSPNSTQCTCAVGYLGNNCEYSDGTAFDFVLIFHGALETDQDHIEPAILVSSSAKSTINLLFYDNKNNISLNFTNKYLQYELPKSVLMTDGIHDAGVNVHSSTPVRVFGFLFHRSASVGILVLPSQFASTQYLLQSFKPLSASDSRQKSVFSVASLNPHTTINISLRLETGSVRYNGIEYKNNQRITIKLNLFSSFQLAHNSDLTGTLITASKPVVVVSGNKANQISGETYNLQPFMEMVLPCNQLDNFYVIPYLKTRPLSTIRILAANISALEILQNDIHKIDRLSARDYTDFNHSRISLVNSSTDILVTMFPHEVKNIGDAFMMPIPGVNQYLYDYHFIVPTNLTFNSFISVTVPTDALHGFVLDGQELSIPSTYNISHNSYHYSTFCLQISNGYHRLLHRAKVRFGLWVYGDYNLDAYGFPAGIAFKTTSHD